MCLIEDTELVVEVQEGGGEAKTGLRFVELRRNEGWRGEEAGVGAWNCVIVVG